jgi:hypothetical protein
MDDSFWSDLDPEDWSSLTGVTPEVFEVLYTQHCKGGPIKSR